MRSVAPKAGGRMQRRALARAPLAPAPRCASSNTSRARSSPRRGSRSPSTAWPRSPTRRGRSPSEIGGPGGDQVPGPYRRTDEGRRRPVRRHARGGGGARRARPRSRDRRPHAPRRARRLARRGQARVLRRRRLGRNSQAAGDAVLRHGRDRHRGGRRAAPGPCRPWPLLDPAAILGLARQAADRLAGHHRIGPEPADADPRPAGPPVSRPTT